MMIILANEIRALRSVKQSIKVLESDRPSFSERVAPVVIGTSKTTFVVFIPEEEAKNRKKITRFVRDCLRCAKLIS